MDFDSAEVENTFLSAIGFESAPKTRKSRWSPLPQHESQGANTHQGPGMNIDPGRLLINSARNLQVQNERQAKVSSSHRARTGNEPQLTNTYWDAQRVAKGIADPAAYPKSAAHTFWHTATRSPLANNLDPWTLLTTSTPPYRLATQSYLPANSNPRLGTPEGEGFRNGPAQQPAACSGSENSDMGRARGGGPRGGGFRGGGPRGGPRGGARGFDSRGDDPRGGDPHAPRLDQVEPDLSIYRMPRPNRDYAGSTYSLPSLGSGINVSDSGLNSTDKSATDIRNTIGLKPSIYKSGNTWTKYNWSNPYGRDEDEKLLTKSYLVPFIGAWMAGIPDKSPVSFHQDADGHWRRDIDTDTGRLLEPVSYPESMADPTPLDPQVDWRRQNWTSTLLRHRYTTRRFGKNKRPNQRNCPDYEEPAIVDENLGEDLAVKVEEPVIERPQFHRFVPKIPSFLRPAEKCDMEAVRAIYNWEVENGVQALDSQPLSVEDFEKILAISQQLGMPFIVAVRGSARDLGLTRGNLSFSVFQQVPFYEQDKRGEVLGFAFLSVWQPGLRGNPTGSSRATAKANVFVHPDYRRKKIGFSLLDMLLTTVSDCFSSETAYDFIDPDNSQVFRKASDGKRQVFKVYLSYRIRHKLRTDGNKQLEDEQKTYDDDLVWVKKILEDGLNFSELVRYEAVHRSPKGREGPVCWFDEVVFEHTCAFDPNVVAADY